MERKFNELQYRDLTNEEEVESSEFLKTFKEKHLVPVYMKFTSSIPKVYNFFNLYRIIINIYKDLKAYKTTFNDYKFDYRYNGYKRDFFRLIRIYYTKIFKIFKEPIEGEKFILFPLQYQPEASTDILAAYHVDQYNVIVNLVKSLPIDYKLYVKEHYAVLGSKEIEFYKKIKKLPNVRLINPWIGINDLIKKSSAIAVLTGTTGLEAIFWEKPVIMFGKVFFDIYPGIYKVNNLNELPDLINKITKEHHVDKTVLKKYVYSYISSGYIGRLHGNNLVEEEIKIHSDNLYFEINGRKFT
jgi:hypothetical protein